MSNVQIKINGSPQHLDVNLRNWDEFMKTTSLELLKQDLGISAVTIDGKSVSFFVPEEFSNIDINSVKCIEIEAKNVYVTMKAVLDEIRRILPETEQFHAQVTALINEGQEKEGIKVLALVLQFWQNLISVVKTVGKVITIKQNKLRNVEEITAEFDQLREISQNVQNSINSGDYVNIADVVESELKPKIWAWEKHINDLYDQLPESVK